MKIITLTDVQQREIALAWVREVQDIEDAKDVIDALLGCAYTKSWAWTDVLRYAARKCCKWYAVDIKYVKSLV